MPMKQTMKAFHGTNQTFERFDPAMLGASTRSESSQEAFFFALSFATAEAYAHSAARKLIPDQAAHEAAVATLLRRAEEAEERGDWDAADELGRQAEDLDLGAIRAAPSGARVLEVEIEVSNPTEMDAEGRWIGDLGDVLRAARAAGHDAVIFRNILDTPDGTGGADDHVAVFSAEAITIVAGRELEPEADFPQP